MKKLSKSPKIFCCFAAVTSLSLYSADVDKTLAELLKDVKNPKVSPAQLLSKTASCQKDLAKESGTVQQKGNLTLAEIYFLLGNYPAAKSCYDKAEKGGNSYKRLQMMLGAVLGETDAKPMLTDFFQTTSKPLQAGEEEQELFERAARRYIEFLLPERFNEARRILEMISELNVGGDKEAEQLAKRQLVLEIAKMRNDIFEQQKRDGKKINKAELEKLKQEIEPLRNIVDGPLTQLYIEALRSAILLEDQQLFDTYLKQAIFYAFEFNYNMENQAASIVRARRKGAAMSRSERIKLEKELLSEFSPYGGMYYYYALNNQMRGDKALKNGNKTEAENFYTIALKSLMVVNQSYLLSSYNDQGMKIFEDICKEMSDKLGKKVKYEYQVRDYYASLLVEISSLLKMKDYKAIEPLVLRSLRRSRKSPESVLKMSDILVKLCWANLPNREFQMVALTTGLNETYPGYKSTDEEVSSPETLLRDAISILLKNVTLQTPEGLKYASIACEQYIQIATDSEKALITALRIADVSYNLALEKAKKAKSENSVVLSEQSRDDFKVAAETYEQIIKRWPDHPLVSEAYYRTAYAYRNANLSLKATQFFMEYAKREVNPEKAQNRINALILAGSVLQRSKEKGAGIQCRDVYQLLYDIASKPTTGIKPEDAKMNYELATMYLAYGHEAAGNEAQRSYEDGRIRIKEIDGEVQQHKALVNSSIVGTKNFEKKKSEIIEELTERIAFFERDFDTSLREMLERMRQTEMGGATSVSDETKAKIEAKLATVARKYRSEYAESRKNEMKLVRRDWDEEVNELKHFVLGQRGIVRGLLDERRATSGSLDGEINEREQIQKRIKEEEKDINSVRAELDVMEGKLKTLQDKREQALKNKDVALRVEISEEISNIEGEINDFKRATGNALSSKRLERLEQMKKRLEQLNISINAGEGQIAPLIKNLNRESAKLEYQEKNIAMLEKSIEYTRLAEQKSIDDPMVVKSGKEIVETLKNLIEVTNKWIALEIETLDAQRQESLAIEQKLLQEAKDCEASFASEQAMEQEEKKLSLIWFEKYLAQNPTDPKYLPAALAKAAFMSVETKDYAKVEIYLAKLVKEFPDSDLAKQAQFTLGRSYAEQGKITEASNAFKKVINESGADLSVSQISYIVDILSKSTTNELLVKLDILDKVTNLALSKASEKNMEYVCQTALLACANTAYEANEVTRAIDYVNKLLTNYKRGRSTVDAQKLLIVCNEKLGNREEVLNSYKRLLNNRYLNAIERIQFRYNMALFCERGGNKESLQEALDNYELIKLSWLPIDGNLTGDDLKERLSLDPVFEDAWAKYVILLARFGQTENAKKLAQEYLANYPQGKYITIINDVPEPDPTLAEIENKGE